MSYRVYQVDAFTKERFRGNPAGVIANADGLSENQMQILARELNNSETAFIFSAEDDSHDVRVRFFTPTVEVPSCGHATVAAHYVRAIENQLPSSNIRQKIGIGILPVEVIKEENDYRIVMTQGQIEFSKPIKGEMKESLLLSLGLNGGDLDKRCPIQLFSTGNSKVIIGIKSRVKLNSLIPNTQNLLEFNEKFPNNGYFVFTFESDNEKVLTHARMFAPQIGIAEDPVTGNGNGPLGAYLVLNNLVEHDGKQFEFTGQQGEAIGRQGVVRVTVKIKNNLPEKVQIEGQAVIAFQTEIEI